MYFHLLFSRVFNLPVKYIFVQAFCGPLAELRAAQGFYTVANGNYHIKVVIKNIMSLCFPLNRSVFCGHSEIPNSHNSVKFTFFKNVLYMLVYCGLRLFKHLGHLLLCKPDGFIRKNNFHIYRFFVGLKNRNLFFHKYLLFFYFLILIFSSY